MKEHAEVIARTAQMVKDADLRQRVAGHGLSLVNVLWEDTARYQGSCVGPNISDLTLQVQHPDPGSQRQRLTLLPVIRAPNFSDRTGDVPLERLFVLVGNHAGQALELLSLRDLLGDLRRYLTRPASWAGDATSLLCDQDSHALVSAQACFLPVPRGGVATFNPVLFNYQSRPGDPAVLAILATPEGTSATIIDNQRDAFSAVQTPSVWGQRLFFNAAGQRASLTGRRQSDVAAARPAGSPALPTPGSPEASGVNVALLIQVPLRQRSRPPVYGSFGTMDFMEMERERGITLPPDLEDAVIGHGELEGPFTEIADLPIERDPRYPVRVTVQLYKATSTGAVNDFELAQIAALIEAVYQEADFAGSLVLDGGKRPTQLCAPALEPPGWWDEFWGRFEASTGKPRAAVIARLRTQMVVSAWSTEWDLRRELKHQGYRLK